jgi:hypothetical protein
VPRKKRGSGEKEKRVLGVKWLVNRLKVMNLMALLLRRNWEKLLNKLTAKGTKAVFSKVMPKV